MLKRQLAPAAVQQITIDRALTSDVRRVRALLEKLGVKPDAIAFIARRPAALDP